MNTAILFKVSDSTRNSMISQIKRHDLAEATFLFDFEEFNKHALYKSIELDNGGILTAQADLFDYCFTQKEIDKSANKYQFETIGVIYLIKPQIIH